MGRVIRNGSSLIEFLLRLLLVLSFVILDVSFVLADTGEGDWSVDGFLRRKPGSPLPYEARQKVCANRGILYLEEADATRFLHQTFGEFPARNTQGAHIAYKHYYGRTITHPTYGTQCDSVILIFCTDDMKEGVFAHELSHWLDSRSMSAKEFRAMSTAQKEALVHWRLVNNRRYGRFGGTHSTRGYGNSFIANQDCYGGRWVQKYIDGVVDPVVKVRPLAVPLNCLDTACEVKNKYQMNGSQSIIDMCRKGLGVGSHHVSVANKSRNVGKRGSQPPSISDCSAIVKKPGVEVGPATGKAKPVQCELIVNTNKNMVRTGNTPIRTSIKGGVRGAIGGGVEAGLSLVVGGAIRAGYMGQWAQGVYKKDDCRVASNIETLESQAFNSENPWWWRIVCSGGLAEVNGTME